MNLNRVELAGNLTRDPEIRYSAKGTAICKFGIAVNRRWKDQTGELKEEVTFIDIDAFGKTAENIGQYFRKGNPIYLEGRLKLDTWTDKQTNAKRQKLGVLLETFQFVGPKAQGSDPLPAAPPAARGSTPAPAESAPTAPDAPAADPAQDDDVPF